MKFRSKKIIFLLSFLCMHSMYTQQIQKTSKYEHNSSIRLNLPFIGIDLQEVKDYPMTFVTATSMLIAVGYLSQDYWFKPIANYVKKIFVMMQEQNNSIEEKNSPDFTKTKAKIYKPGEMKIKLKDVAGLQAAKLDVFDIIQFLQHPKAYTDMGAKIPKGILLQGPAGTGKTLLAKAVAGEVNCPFISVCASEFMEMYVGVGSARLRDLFAKAKELAPCIIFFDEFDAIGKKRMMGSGGTGNGDEQAHTLGQLLALMDGFDMQTNPIIIIASTNRAEVLDPAIIRPGRFDRIVNVELPHFHDRIDILNLHLHGVKKSHDIDVVCIARATAGFSGADLAHVINEAAILAVNEESSCLEMRHIDQAYDNITLGREIQGMYVDNQDLWQTAIHEAGHCIARVFLDAENSLYKVTITPRGNALGMSYALPLREKYSLNEAEMKTQIKIALAGGLAEQICNFGKTTGLYSDLIYARTVAYSMVTEYGMSDQLRYMSYADIDYYVPNDVATKIHDQVQHIIDECYEEVLTLMQKHRIIIMRLARMLMDQGTIFGTDIYDLCGVQEPTLK